MKPAAIICGSLALLFSVLAVTSGDPTLFLLVLFCGLLCVLFACLAASATSKRQVAMLQAAQQRIPQCQTFSASAPDICGKQNRGFVCTLPKGHWNEHADMRWPDAAKAGVGVVWNEI